MPPTRFTARSRCRRPGRSRRRWRPTATGSARWRRPAVAERLGIAVGDEFRVGEAVLRLRATIASQPDAAFAGIAFGPRVILSQAALARTGLIQPGALVNYEYRLRLPPGSDSAAWIRAARAAFPEAGWQLRGSADASPSLRRLFERVGFFLNLVGITALLVGGVGIGNAVAGYIASKTEAIATLKCLGASTRLVFAAYALQILALALAGIAGGLLLGAVAPLAGAALLKGLLPASVPLRPLPGRAGAGGALRVAGDCWCSRCGRSPRSAGCRPGRSGGSGSRRRRARSCRWPLAASAAAALGLAAVIVATRAGPPGRAVVSRRHRGRFLRVPPGRLAGRRRRAAGAAAVAAGVAAGRSATCTGPGAPTARIVLSLGLGLSVIVAVALVEGNLAVEIDDRLAERAPADFFIDIQPDQLAGFAEIVRGVPGASFEQVPMLRGRMTRLNGVPVEQAAVAADAQWALRNDRGLTYAATPPKGSRIVAGNWWPADYRGPPLVSFDAELAQGMGLKIGDTLTVNLLGREITAHIANLRQIDWSRLGINFAIVFAPGALEAAPQTHLAAVYAAPAEAERHRAPRSPTGSRTCPRSRCARRLAAVSRVVATIGRALRLVALVTLACRASWCSAARSPPGIAAASTMPCC